MLYLNKPYVTAQTNELVWRYEPAPSVRCLLLTTGKVVTVGPPTGAWKKEYIAWCPFPKRNKDIEKEILHGED